MAMLLIAMHTPHSVKLRIQTDCQQFSLEEKEEEKEVMDTTKNPPPSHPHPSQPHNPTSAHQSQPKEQETS